MDLPTCPACGQSVLDDDAQECPFCGAAMDGSAKAKKASAKPAAPVKTKSAEKPQRAAKPDNDDPFAIAQQPTGQKVLQCAPKPMKGRLTKVVCPMCDTPGFIPKGALGRQVRCANRECMVPVFTAGAESKATPKAPARVSEEESVRPKPTSKGASDKKPLVLYGIIAAVLLGGTVGLVAFLNKPAPKELGAADMSQFDFSGNGDDPEPTTTVPASTDSEPAVTDYQAAAAELVEEMIRTARVNAGNRDKAFCRLLTGDAFQRLGLAERAETEFAQMAKVSSNRPTAYYRIGPLIAEYWKHLLTGDQAAANQAFQAAKALAGEIPRTGSIAVESGIVLAVAMAEAGDAAGAVALVEGQQRDATVVSQIDAIRHGVWSATGNVLRNAGRQSLLPLQVFAWHEPLNTAVGIELAVRQRWPSATAWASALSNPLTASDTFAAIAEQMIALDAPADAQQALLEAAQAKGPAIAFRTQSVLAQKSGNTAAWAAAKTAAAGFAPARPAAFPSVDSLINDGVADPVPGRLSAAALTDFVIAAVQNGDPAAADTGLQQAYAALSAQIPPTVTLRQASRQLEQDEDGVKERVGKEMSLSNENRIRTSFLGYRRGVDRLAGLAEERRLVMLQLLSRVIDRGGLETVRKTLAAESSDLKQEVFLDDLKGLLFVAAATAGQSYPEILTGHPELAVAISRVDPLPEASVVSALVQAWQQYQKSSSSAAATLLESATELPGLRASMVAFMTEQSSRKATSAAVQLAAIAALQDDLWREECLPIATRLLTRQGLLKDIQPNLTEAARTPTQKQVALYGMVRGIVDVEAAAK